MKKILIAGLIAAGLTAQANAEGFYVGGSIGSAKVDKLKDMASAEVQAAFDFGATSASATHTKHTSASKIFGGYQLHPNVAIEFGYADLGDHTVDLVSDVFNEKLTYSSKATFVDAVGSAKLGESFSIFGKIGYARTTTKQGFQDSSENLSISTTKNGIKYGLGFDYAFSKNIGARFEYEIYSKLGTDSDLLFSKKSDIGVMSLGLTYRF